MQVILIDIETTGLSDHDEIIELGALLCSFPVQPSSNRMTEVSRLHAFRNPSCEISNEAKAVHGLSHNLLIGKRFDNVRISNFLLQSNLFIAHNCEFDKKFLLKQFPDLRKALWLCSANHIDWAREQCTSRKLSYLFNRFGLPKQKHRALEDALGLKMLLETNDRFGITFYCQLLQRLSPQV